MRRRGCPADCCPRATAWRTRSCLQLRSLDLSQNSFVYEEGDETATLSQLTGLECLKLANCRMTEASGAAEGLQHSFLSHLLPPGAAPCALTHPPISVCRALMLT
jgi:hypothetical protein